MKVVILHQHFTTPAKGGAIRSYYLAKALTQKGHQVIVITAHGEKKYDLQHYEGIELHLLPIAYNNRYGFYKRGMAFIRYVTGALKVMRRIKTADLCYAISVPITVGLAAIWIKRRYKVPFIFEVGDLWPDAPVQMGFIQNPVLRESLYRLERRIYHDAKRIVALSPAIEKAIRRKAPLKQIHMIPNMADTDFFRPDKKNDELIKKFGVEGKFVVSYTGAVGYANGLDYYLECARASQKADLPIHFLLCGDGKVVDHLYSSAKQLHLKNLTFIPFQNRDGVQQVMNVTDAAFICYRPVSILETGSPNKYFDALAGGKLIIINFGGWIREEIEKQRCGVYIDPRYPSEFVTQIKPFLRDANLLQAYCTAARTLAEQRYSRRELSEKFVSMVIG